MQARPNALLLAAPSILVATLALAPFLGKAYTIDDTLFLREAEHMLRDFWHPTAFDMVWGEARERFSTILSSGPVGAALLLPAVAHGGAEWIAHAMQLAMLAIALVATARLALRLGLTPSAARWTTLLLATTPAVLGMAGTAMPDVAAMALGVWAMERLLAYRDDGRWHQAAAGVLLLTLAVLARAHFVLLAAVAALALPRRRWLPLVLAPLVAFAAMRLFRDHDATLATTAARYSTGRSLDRNLVAFAVHWVLALPLAIPWTIRRWRSMPWKVALIAVPVAAGLLWNAEHTRWLWIAPIAGLGAVVLTDVVRTSDRMLAAWLFVALPAAIYVHLPSKYLLASAPAVALLVAPMLSRRLAAATCAVALLVGVLIVRADAVFAGLGRRAAAELVAPAVARGEHVWILGHWGFQWYAERAGAQAFGSPPPAPPAGDLVITAAQGLNDLWRFLPPRRRLVTTLADATPGGRVMSRPACAGFFSNAWGYLPWSFGTAEIDRFEVWRVE
jgi:hypothetical protein